MSKILFKNCFVHTFDSKESVFSFMGVDNGRISYLGDSEPTGYKKVVDLGGGHVAPSLYDSHMHLLYTIILSAESFVISEIKGNEVYPKCAEDALSRIKEFAEAHPKNKVIVANGFIPSAFSSPRLLTKAELDEAAPGKAVIVYTIDGHSSSLSSKMLEELGIESEDGIMRGESHEFIQGKVTDVIAKNLNVKILANGIASFINTLRAYGLRGVSALDGNEDVENDILTKYLSILATKLPIDIALYPEYQDYGRAETFFKKQRMKRCGGCGAWELDGSVGSKSAAFYSPYKDSDDSGHTYYSDEHIRSKVKEAFDKGILLTAHAIGPKAIDQIVNAYYSNQDRLDSCDGLYRIDHFEFPTKDAVSKATSMRIGITVQPGFSYIDKLALHSYEKYLSKEMLDLIVPLKRIMDSKAILLGSSDSPVQDLDPYLQMRGMVDYYDKTQSLSPLEAYKTYSVNAGIVRGEDWSLHVGGEAVFNLYKRNPEMVSLDKSDLIASYRDGKKLGSIKHPLLYMLSLPFRKSRKI